MGNFSEGRGSIKTLACNKSFASLFNFQAYYCFSVDVDAIQLQAVRDWNNTHCFNGCVSGLPGPLGVCILDKNNIYIK